MTIKQIQHLLAYLGYYKSPVDGQWGPGSKAACEAFQRAFGGIQADGIPGRQTQDALRHAVAFGLPEREDKPQEKPVGDFWPRVRYFTRNEFRCTCPRCGGFPVEPDEEMVRVVDEIRHRAGVPIAIVDSGGSGIRCPAHNAEVKGVSNSCHLTGKAADLHCRGKTPAQLKAIAEAVTKELIPGRGGIGLYDWGIHVDTGKYARWNG